MQKSSVASLSPSLSSSGLKSSPSATEAGGGAGAGPLPLAPFSPGKRYTETGEGGRLNPGSPKKDREALNNLRHNKDVNHNLVLPQVLNKKAQKNSRRSIATFFVCFRDSFRRLATHNPF